LCLFSVTFLTFEDRKQNLLYLKTQFVPRSKHSPYFLFLSFRRVLNVICSFLGRRGITQKGTNYIPHIGYKNDQLQFYTRT